MATDRLHGKFCHSIDAKNRLIIPSKLKDTLGPVVILTKNKGCINLYSEKEWKDYTAKVDQVAKSKAENLVRFLYSNAQELNPDSQGRILIPQEYIDYASITKNVVTVGCGKYAEIWSEEVWNEKALDKEPEDYAELMIEFDL